MLEPPSTIGRLSPDLRSQPFNSRFLHAICNLAASTHHKPVASTESKPACHGLLWDAQVSYGHTFLYKRLPEEKMNHSEAFLKLVEDSKVRIHEVSVDEVVQKQKLGEVFTWWM